MKCYTFSAGELSEGIVVPEKDLSFSVLTFGRSCSRSAYRFFSTKCDILAGSRIEEVQLLTEKPPEVKEGVLHEAECVFSKNEDLIGLRKAEREKDNRVLVHINTRETYSSSLSGCWKILEEDKCMNAIVTTGVYNISLNIKTEWEDGLVIMSPGGVVCIKTNSGGIYLLNYHKDKGLLLEPIILE